MNHPAARIAAHEAYTEDKAVVTDAIRQGSMDHLGRIIRVTSAAALFGLSACSVSLPGTTDPDAIHFTGQTGPAARVIVREEDYPERKYSSLGEVTVLAARPTIFHHNPTRDTVNQMLREAGARLGADGVIFVRYEVLDKGFFKGVTYEGKGLAIKFLP